MSHDRLYSSLLSSVSEGVTVVKLAHSGGVVQRVSMCRECIYDVYEMCLYCIRIRVVYTCVYLMRMK